MVCLISKKMTIIINKNIIKMSKIIKKKLFRVVIAGSRDFDDYDLLKKICGNYLGTYKKIEIVSGCDRGADRLGEKYAREMGYKTKRFPAEWDRWGRSAGYRRNIQMAEYADAVIVFWDGKSKGTKQMMDVTRSLDKALEVVKYQSEKENIKILPDGLRGKREL